MTKTINFTGLVVSSDELFREYDGRLCDLSWPIHPDWESIAFDASNFYHPSMEDTINKWLFNNIEGKWSIFLLGGRVIVWFENAEDAVIFALKNGENECVKVLK